MKEKGQALVEFILIMPIMLLVFIALIDIGNIFVQKYNLNNSLEIVTDLYQNDEQKELKAYVANEEIEYKESTNNNLVTITVKKNIKLSAPGLTQVLGKTYTAEAKKTIYKDSDNDE